MSATRQAAATPEWRAAHPDATPYEECTAEHASAIRVDGVDCCRDLVCARCGQHTGDNNQGHYWKSCRVLRERLQASLAPGEQLSAAEFLKRTGRDGWHFCCGEPYGCELEAGAL